MASITVRPVSGRKTCASRLLMPQSSEPEPFRKKPWPGGGMSTWKFFPSPSASGIPTLLPFRAHDLAGPARSWGDSVGAHAQCQGGSVPRDFLLQEIERLNREDVLAGKERSPDLGRGGAVGQEVAESLHRQPAVVADVSQRVEGRVPPDRPGARHTAVVLRDMHLGDACARLADPRGGGPHA